MPPKFLLPCPCGNRIPVDLRQAGQSVTCPCGRTLGVPTMRDIRQLEPVASEQAPAARSTAWGARHRVALVGLIVTLASTAGLAYFFWTKPVSPTDLLQPGQIHRNISQRTLSETFWIWADVQGELARDDPRFKLYREQLTDYHIRLGVTAVFLVLGVLILLGSFLIPGPAVPREEALYLPEPTDAAAAP